MARRKSKKKSSHKFLKSVILLIIFAVIWLVFQYPPVSSRIKNAVREYLPKQKTVQLVQEQLDKVFHSHDVLVELATRTQLPQRVISDIFRENFWTHVTPAEFTRMAQLILDKVTLFEDHIELDIKSSGMESIMEEFTENDA